MATKTFEPGLHIIVRTACRYVTRYRAKIEQTLRTGITDPTALAAALAWLSATITVCGILDQYFPLDNR